MEKLKITAVSYFNTLPFLYGLEQSNYLDDKIQLNVDYPAICAQKLKSGDADIGLVPVAIIPSLKISHIVSKYCIGATGPVDSVLLLSEVPLDSIEKIYLDYQSQTSVTLVRILASLFWNISPTWINAEAGFETKIEGRTAGVVIGDRTFGLIDKYPYVYDLAQEWINFTNLPFVFAVWLAVKPIDPRIKEELNAALALGINNIDKTIAHFQQKLILPNSINEYLTHKISYPLDQAKTIGLNRFLSYFRAMQANKAKIFKLA